MVVTHQLVKFFLKLIGPWAEVHDLIFKFLVDSPTWVVPPSERESARGWVLSHIRSFGVYYDHPSQMIRWNFVAEIPDEFDFSYPTESDFAEGDEESIETVDSETRGQRKRRRIRFHPEGR
jgi:hypothetical protein